MKTASITPDQRAKEKSIAVAIGMDAVIISLMGIVGFVGGSLTLIAETIRATLMLLIELFAFSVMRLVHRERLLELDFGTGKIERFANLAIAIGMLFGALWISRGVYEIIVGGRVVAPPIWLAGAAIIASVNAWVNIVTWYGMRRAAKRGKSVIMQAQLQARFVKLASSLFVQVTMTIAAVTTDDGIAIGAEAVGSTFVAAFIIWNAWQMFRSGLPDILDRSVEEEVQMAINRSLAAHFNDFELLGRVRTRRSGDAIFVELSLGYAPEITMAELGRRISEMTETLLSEIDGADVTITPWAHSG